MSMTSFASYPPPVEDKAVYITADPIDIAALLNRAHDPNAGAVVLFSGEVRNNSNGKMVAYLEYEAQVKMASNMIEEIIRQASQQWNLHIVIAVHRIGKVLISEPAVVVITATGHRREAYDANRYIIDRIKHEVPIWKCEYFSDGTKQWGGNCNCHAITGEVGKHVYEE